MLELKSVSWRNFLSYGDYITTIELDKLGQCLIVGEVIEDGMKHNRSDHGRKSNGAGKSTIPNVIQWVLFGRTMHSRTPGDKIVNWFSGKDCWAKITFKNGDSIIRTRNVDGKNELLISRNGDETRFTSDTLSTSTNQQNQLNKIFNLDWEIFCGSVFFNQYGKPWMEMADATRKKAIERVLHVDRFTFYAQAAKGKCENLDKLVAKHRQFVEMSENNIQRLELELNRLKNSSDSFESNKERRIQYVAARIETGNRQRDLIMIPDVNELKKKWALIRQVEEKISAMRVDLNQLNMKISTLSGSVQNYDAQIKLWEQKSGKICTSCEQQVDKGHTSTKIGPIFEKRAAKQSELDSLNKQRHTIINKIKGAESILASRKPEMTLDAANEVIARRKRCDREIDNSRTELEEIRSETNPHNAAIVDVTSRIDKAKEEIENTRKDLERSELLNKHYRYIYKAYNDRTKIKSFVFSDHIPFINSRLRHYLEVFELDVKIELTESLGVTSNMWGYEFESGGERKRTDVAFMLAMFDFHEQMYGRQCNVLVLDEVDGRLDDDGIGSLINIIKTDLAHRVETILVISHRNLMFDTFTREMHVVRKDRFSSLEIL